MLLLKYKKASGICESEFSFSKGKISFESLRSAQRNYKAAGSKSS